MNSLQSTSLYVGQNLKIGTSALITLSIIKTHKIVRRDTLWSISRKYSVSFNNIMN